MQLFQYVIFWTPTEAQVKEGKKPEILKELTTILAKDQPSANIQAARAIPETHMDAVEQVTIALRPF
jgi:hypothetical protein